MLTVKHESAFSMVKYYLCGSSYLYVGPHASVCAVFACLFESSAFSLGMQSECLASGCQGPQRHSGFCSIFSEKTVDGSVRSVGLYHMFRLRKGLFSLHQNPVLLGCPVSTILRMLRIYFQLCFKGILVPEISWYLTIWHNCFIYLVTVSSWKEIVSYSWSREKR